jgi:hypothetical protein
VEGGVLEGFRGRSWVLDSDEAYGISESRKCFEKCVNDNGSLTAVLVRAFLFFIKITYTYDFSYFCNN